MAQPINSYRHRPARWGAAAALSLLVLTATAVQAEPYEFDLPTGFPPPRVPANNPMTTEKVELGRFLFYDTRLSGNQTQSCASCHQQALAFTDGMPHGVGSTGQAHPRGSMSLANVLYATTLAWANPLLFRIEDQVLIPLFGENPVELGLAGMEDELLARLRADARYRDLFGRAFPEDAQPISVANLARGLASFVRTMISGNSAYDRYVFGLDDDAISRSALRGAFLFFGTNPDTNEIDERFECSHCHNGFNFNGATDRAGRPLTEIVFHNTGLFNIGGTGTYPSNNTGTFEITGRQEDMGHFKAPTLRNIELTAPYMHDGSIATLEEVIEVYSAGGRVIEDGPNAGDGRQNPFKSGFVRGFRATQEEKDNVRDFLLSLTDTEFIHNPKFSNPFDETPTPTPTVTPGPGACYGDCDGDGQVEINELVRGVNIILGHDEMAVCPEFDGDGNGTLTIDELVKSVKAVLRGCKPQ